MTPEQKAWVADMEKAITSTLSPLSLEGQKLLIAHGAFESGWGKSNAYRRGFNFGNLTAGKSWAGAKWTDVGGDSEYDKDGRKKIITQQWRAYPTLNDAVSDYWDFLGGPRYAHARDALAKGDAFQFCTLLSKGGYFTLPCSKYVAGLNGVLALF